MSEPWLPPYLGSWNDLINALLHNPFLGGGQGGNGHPPRPMMTAPAAAEGRYQMGPQPEPWFASTATSLLMSAINLKLVASHLPKDQGAELEHAAGQTIAEEIDFICGTPPRGGPPRPWPFLVGLELIAFANALPEGDLRSQVLDVGGRVVQQSLGVAAAAREEEYVA